MRQSTFAVDLSVDVIRRAQRGETAAFKKVYDAFQSPAYNLALKLSQCPEVARDILQEGMLLVFRKIGQYRFDAPFWGWLRKLFINTCLSELRRQKRWQRWQDVPLDEEALQVAEATQSSGCERDLEQALGQLPPLRCTVIWLHAVEGYTHREIADMAEISEANSRAQLSRARKELQASLPEMTTAEATGSAQALNGVS
ncbi:MAG: sigma-70 family RNA polymerase sigma factor [Porticoccaceae bacterium]|nr:sigma-70 family RNA polymerase sigma factor [Porticoccaceae bacterium]